MSAAVTLDNIYISSFYKCKLPRNLAFTRPVLL